MTQEQQIKEIVQESFDSIGTPLSEMIGNAVGKGYELGWNACFDAVKSTEHGKELLYVCSKTAKRTKKETIRKACEWLDKHLLDYWQQVNTNNDYFIEDFKQAMEE